MFLIGLNYLSFVYLASGMINALTWVIIFFIIKYWYLKTQTQDCYCWVIALAKCLVDTPQMSF